MQSASSSQTLNFEPPTQQRKQKPAAKPKTQHVKSEQSQQQDGAKKGAKPAKGPKGPKGPKGAKPKPVTYEFYYQQLAADAAETMRKELGAENTESKRTLADLLKPRERTLFTSAAATVLTMDGDKTKVIETVFSRPSTSTERTASSQDLSLHKTRSSPTKMLSRIFNPRILKNQNSGSILSLDDLCACNALESLMERFGGVQHGGMLDKKYRFFVNKAQDAALSFIVKDKIAVLGGDPLCEPSKYSSILAEFKLYRKQKGLGIAILGGGPELLEYAKAAGWVAMRFGTERVLNPMNNDVLKQKAQKQIIRQNKQLLDPERGGLTLHVYSSANGSNPGLEAQLAGVYEAWRNARNTSGVPQAYTTIYDPFALPSLMIYVYTRDKEGVPNGFAALRRMGNRDGYYIDPCVAAPGAPRRITDLLYFSAMALLNDIGCSYLSIGMEPCAELEIHGFPNLVKRMATQLHSRLFKGLKLAGKQEYFNKFRPDEELSTGVHLMFPSGVPSVRHVASVLHATNISVRKLVRTKLDYKGAGAKAQPQAVVVDDAGDV